MLYTVTELRKFKIGATDGDIGEVSDLYFDGQRWTVRYLVVDTGNWLPGRRVLLSPMSLQGVDDEGRRLLVGLTKKQVEQSPPFDSVKPVSRQYEVVFSRYYGYPYYWTGPYRWGLGYEPYAGPIAAAVPSTVEEEIAARERENADPNLHSANEVMGYYIQASDDDIGHVEDFLVDDRTWAIRYLIVDTRNWLPGKRVLVAPPWVSDVSWGESKVFVDLTRDRIERAPEYDPSRRIERSEEEALHTHYGRAPYWSEERFVTGEEVFQPGVYTSQCCRYGVAMAEGEIFPPCGGCSRPAGWIRTMPAPGEVPLRRTAV